MTIVPMQKSGIKSGTSAHEPGINVFKTSQSPTENDSLTLCWSFHKYLEVMTYMLDEEGLVIAMKGLQVAPACPWKVMESAVYPGAHNSAIPRYFRKQLPCSRPLRLLAYNSVLFRNFQKQLSC